MSLFLGHLIGQVREELWLLGQSAGVGGGGVGAVGVGGAVVAVLVVGPAEPEAEAVVEAGRAEGRVETTAGIDGIFIIINVTKLY